MYIKLYNEYEANIPTDISLWHWILIRTICIMVYRISHPTAIYSVAESLLYVTIIACSISSLEK